MIKLTNTKDITSDRFVSLIIGESGVGKTSLAKTIKEGKTLILSAESGLLCLKGTDIDVYDITKDDDGEAISGNEEKMKRVVKFFEFLMNKEAREYKNIFIDSLTDFAEVFAKDAEEVYEKNRNPKEKRNGFEIWGNYTRALTAFVKSIRDMPHFNVFFTCLLKEEKDGFNIIERPHIQGESIKNSLKSWFDVVMVYKIYEDKDGVKHRKMLTDSSAHPLGKDRSGSLELYENPDLQVIMDKVLK